MAVVTTWRKGSGEDGRTVNKRQILQRCCGERQQQAQNGRTGCYPAHWERADVAKRKGANRAESLGRRRDTHERGRLVPTRAAD